MIQILIQCLNTYYGKRQLKDFCVSSTLTAIAFYTLFMPWSWLMPTKDEILSQWQKSNNFQGINISPEVLLFALTTCFSHSCLFILMYSFYITPPAATLQFLPTPVAHFCHYSFWICRLSHGSVPSVVNTICLQNVLFFRSLYCISVY